MPEVGALNREKAAAVEATSPIEPVAAPTNGPESSADETTASAAMPTPLPEASTDDPPAPDAAEPEHSDRNDSDSDSDAESDKASVTSDDIDWKARILAKPLHVSVGEFNYEDFKNRWGEEEGYHAIELLIGSDNLPDECSREKSRRINTSSKGQRQELKSKGGAACAETWVQRIRVHSPYILQYLSEVMRPPTWNTEQPRVFFRPFKCLINYHPQMREALAELERQVGEGRPEVREPSPTDETKETTKDVDGDGKTPAETTDRVDDWDRTTALKHLRCYVDFMDKRIMPLQDMFTNTDQRQVRFHDLWYLFNVGDDLYAPAGPSTRDSGGIRRVNGRYQTAFRLFWKGLSTTSDQTPDDFRVKDRALTLDTYYVDHDGASYGAVNQVFEIDAYDGHMDIRDLVVYPMRFADGREDIRAQLTAQGTLFRKFVHAKHVSCEGWTVTGPPLGASDDDTQPTPDHIDSDVIVDLAEAMRREPKWKPVFLLPYRTEVFYEYWKNGIDDTEIQHWPAPDGDNNKTSDVKPWFNVVECTQLDDDTEQKLKTNLLEDNLFFKAYSRGVVPTLDGLDEDITLLLPRRIHVYVLRQRRFAMVDVFSLEDISPQATTIFDDLRIDPSHKVIVQSLVADHFEKRRLQRQQPRLGHVNQDLVRGKGSGLFILLHGVPGVGKTATAEAVAQANDKPLFTITCGDLGLTPEAVESKLNEVFQLAHLWDCVLLLDEADIFLAKRDTFNLKRNALVSVFLRTLEYYGGILFLTTNRVGIIDEAFKSRIHISLYYEPLSRSQTIEIFRVNIRKLREIEDAKEKLLSGDGGQQQQQHPRLSIKAKSIVDYAKRHWDEYADAPHLRWNGRQIRNAFQIASSLAHYTMRARASGGQTDAGSAEQVACPVLDATQFDKVADAVERFGHYLDETKAMTDADQARLDNTRADNMRNEHLGARRAQQSPYGQPATPSPAQSRRPVGGLQPQQRRPPAYGGSPQVPAPAARGRGGTRAAVGSNTGQTIGAAPAVRGASRVSRTGPPAQPPPRSPAPGRAQPGQLPRRRAAQAPPAPEPEFDDDYDDDALGPAGAAHYGAYAEETYEEGYDEDFDDEGPEPPAAEAVAEEDYDD
ncbi:AAA family [Colletotrichum plurivorum]|uniref:AAA family n=1 Tax=Colletotrichum plurivorum TaxID=2175906 RepID=A0A8H6N822_9PEZI|nr:AAA family [Colletotrichum plurivorum]